MLLSRKLGFLLLVYYISTFPPASVFAISSLESSGDYVYEDGGQVSSTVSQTSNFPTDVSDLETEFNKTTKQDVQNVTITVKATSIQNVQNGTINVDSNSASTSNSAESIRLLADWNNFLDNGNTEESGTGENDASNAETIENTTAEPTETESTVTDDNAESSLPSSTSEIIEDGSGEITEDLTDPPKNLNADFINDTDSESADTSDAAESVESTSAAFENITSDLHPISNQNTDSAISDLLANMTRSFHTMLPFDLPVNTNGAASEDGLKEQSTDVTTEQPISTTDSPIPPWLSHGQSKFSNGTQNAPIFTIDPVFPTAGGESVSETYKPATSSINPVLPSILPEKIDQTNGKLSTSGFHDIFNITNEKSSISPPDPGFEEIFNRTSEKSSVSPFDTGFHEIINKTMVSPPISTENSAEIRNETNESPLPKMEPSTNSVSKVEPISPSSKCSHRPSTNALSPLENGNVAIFNVKMSQQKMDTNAEGMTCRFILDTLCRFLVEMNNTACSKIKIEIIDEALSAIGIEIRLLAFDAAGIILNGNDVTELLKTQKVELDGMTHSLPSNDTGNQAVVNTELPPGTSETEYVLDNPIIATILISLVVTVGLVAFLSLMILILLQRHRRARKGEWIVNTKDTNYNIPQAYDWCFDNGGYCISEKKRGRLEDRRRVVSMPVQPAFCDISFTGAFPDPPVPAPPSLRSFNEFPPTYHTSSLNRFGLPTKSGEQPPNGPIEIEMVETTGHQNTKRGWL